ncbi:gamma-glutamyl-gamma-aminobutyrate hydrolase family protein [Kurthia huakuii]|uniref:gamma-glutamyl-gamma-aminobutyrate hydrolase family protein n=1 Tax=Kurthia huakuii TaxID=1421019 RepID=UPI0004967E58|nr:gamma-glutamyl-gamma-aminobutyrate hydrolase family protein [Kurthia huakuii]MBM7699545.1 putative glutamine amidotransferase [Kurthia huakuii]
MKPIIGITMQPVKGAQQLNQRYIESILAAGGVPLCIPNTTPIGAIISRLDGLLVIGGDDIHPKFFDEEPHRALGYVDITRDESDIAAINAALSQQMPLLAICRGAQVLNVALGGSVYQDIPSQLPQTIQHKQASSRATHIHTVHVVAQTKLAAIVHSDSIMTNSFHHQSVKDVAPALIVSATTSDGVIEAIEHPDEPFCVGVQWHPEELHDEASSQLFHAFVEACHH